MWVVTVYYRHQICIFDVFKLYWKYHICDLNFNEIKFKNIIGLDEWDVLIVDAAYRHIYILPYW